MNRVGKDPLTRYTSILRGQARPRFQEAKAATVEGSSTTVLDRKISSALELWSDCQLCEHRCRAKRGAGQVGRCGVAESHISTHFPHYGEERPLVPSYTIFFSGCNLFCMYCQNWDISTDPCHGEIIPPRTLARLIEARGTTPLGASACQSIRNVNWVGGDPIPHLPYVLQVLRELEIDLPQVWNSNMYMTVETMSLLEGVMDIYLTDLKYGNDRCAERLSAAPRYWEIITRNHMLATKQGEVIVRHLMLPGHLECCTFPVLEWIAENVPQAAVNIMDQFRPEHRAMNFQEIRKKVSLKDYRSALDRAKELDLALI